ncbi:MAG: hypothetical protein KC731_16695, partial [Myxococcales bacterium]|nr:hypothetical protein [Myxococcales bacterium]
PTASAASAPDAPRKAAMTAAEYKQLVEDLSEPDADFFSDNFISNETSYLQPVKLLQSRPPGGVYVGVGPEQNFTYLALTKPELAFIVDIRRDNLVLHLMYKAIFDLAESRTHFLALLTGRRWDADRDPGPEASIEAVLEAVSEAKDDGASRRAIKQTIGERYGITLGKKDEKSLDDAAAAFAEEGPDIRFRLRENSTRKYPSLAELAAAKSPEGEQAGFLASEEAFRFVQRLQRENRVVPMVGDFGGDHALPALGKWLHDHDLVVRHFYTSNVEQYLMVDGKWWKWQRNVKSLPSDDDSAFIRGYLDQGRHHPNQMKGHRTATILQPMSVFLARDKPYPSMVALCSDSVMATP